MAERTPEEKLEDLRFFVIEGEANFKQHLSRWMQEVERQIAELRVAAQSTLPTTRAELDALALREHLAANPTPPSGSSVVREVVAETPAKTTTFYKRDGSPLIEITVGPVKHLRTILRRKQ